MFAANKISVMPFNLEAFLSKLGKTLMARTENAVAAMHFIPQWASNYTHLLYAPKSVPPGFNEPGKLYIACKADEPHAVNLIGQTLDKKPVNRKLKITQKAGNLIIIISEHKDFKTGKYYSCVGIGKNFKAALDQYFLNSDLKNYAYNTEKNIQKEGDAFHLIQTINTKGHKRWVSEIINMVRQLIQLLPQENHPAVKKAIEKNIKNIDLHLKPQSAGDAFQHYDARLWIIVESVCKHIDPLTTIEAHKRKEMRDYLIAKCCSKLAKGEDIIPKLKDYLDAMKMNLEIFAACHQNDPDGRLNTLIQEYQRSNCIPEAEAHHTKIKEWHASCKIENPVSLQHKPL